jgi:hypothetical protein
VLLHLDFFEQRGAFADHVLSITKHDAGLLLLGSGAVNPGA